MQLNTESWGPDDGPLVVCLHGVTSRLGRFRRLAREALPGFRVVGVDLRGHGESGWSPPWDLETHVADLLETVEEPAIWIGHSFGGRLVAELAARAPDHVERAVLLDPALHIDPSTALMQAETTRLEARFGSLAEYVDFRFSSGTILRAPRDLVEAESAEDLVPGEDTRLRVHYCRSAVVTAWSEMATPAPPLPKCPTLVVLGEASWIPFREEPRPNVEIVKVPGGHTVLWDAYDETAAAIAAFLSQML
jgi:lipase